MADHACICGNQDPCLCGFHVPEPFERIDYDAADRAPKGAPTAADSAGASVSEMVPAEEQAPVAPSEDATEQGSAAAADDRAPAAADSAFRFMVGPRFMELGLSSLEKPQPRDLEAQQRAACSLEAARLKKEGTASRGGSSSDRRVASPPSAAIEAVDEEEMEILGAYCELQLLDDLLEACASSRPSPPPAGGDGVTSTTPPSPSAKTPSAAHPPEVPLAVQRLLDDDDVCVNLADHTGRTPLMAAATAGHAGTVAALILRGAELDATDMDGHTAFWYACANGHDGAAATLLDFGCLAATGYGEASPTALGVAVARGHAGVVALLLDRAAEEESRAKGGRPADAAPVAPCGLAAAVRSMLTSHLVRYAGDIDEGEIARALARHLHGTWPKPDPDTPGHDLRYGAEEGDASPAVAAAAAAAVLGGAGRDLDPEIAAASADMGSSGEETPLRRGVGRRVGALNGRGPGQGDGGADAEAAEASSSSQGTSAEHARSAGASEVALEDNAEGDDDEEEAGGYDERTGVLRVGPDVGHPIWHPPPGWLDTVEIRGPQGAVTQAVKDEVASGPPPPAKEPVSGGAKAGKGGGGKRGRGQEAEEEEELKPGLLDVPVEVGGKRPRALPQAFTYDAEWNEPKNPKGKQGRGRGRGRGRS